MPDLYDSLYNNPEHFQKLENSFLNKCGRGHTFSFAPVPIYIVPERKKVRALFSDKYGIENIDSYYVPIILDNATFLATYGQEEDYSLDAFFNPQPKRFGYVKEVPGGILGLMTSDCARYNEMDMVTEHEGIHAYMYKNNPHFTNLKPRINGSNLRVTKDLIHRAWTEAVAFFATEDVEIEEIVDTYAKELNLITVGRDVGNHIYQHVERIRSDLHNKNLLQKIVYLDAFRKGFVAGLPEKSIFQIPKVLHTTYALTHSCFISENKQHWINAFNLARDIKEKKGVKELIQIAGTYSADEARRLL